MVALNAGFRARFFNASDLMERLIKANRQDRLEEMLARALNGNPHLQQFRILFITGIRSGILSRLDRGSMELDVRRAFTSVQLKTILEENHHSFLIVEHDQQL